MGDTGDDATRLVGREDEERRMRAVVGAARDGTGGALLVTGEPGIGKTALLRSAVGDDDGAQVLRVDGYEAEATIPFAAVGRLIAPLQAHSPDLPARHQQALDTAAGLVDGPPPDPYLVGLGVLGLLAAAAEDSPVIGALDDLHWFDAESVGALAFVARRLRVEPVALLFTARDDDRIDVAMAGIPRLRLAGLWTAPAVALLEESLGEAVDPLAATRIATATGGNPLALIELATELTAPELAAAGIAGSPLPVGRRLEAHYARRAQQAGPDVPAWLLIAAADSTGDLALVARAAEALDVPAGGGETAEAAGLIDLGTIVTFRHPLVRAAVYNAAGGVARRRTHAALAAAATDLGLTELGAWHAGRAVTGTDDGVADRLEAAADLAARRGGLVSRASVLTRAAELTSDADARAERRIAAAEAALAAGGGELAKGLLAGVDRADLEPPSLGRLISVRVGVALFTADAPGILRASADMLAAADCFRGADPVLEQQALVKAFDYCLTSERLREGVTLAELGRRLDDGARRGTGPAATVLRGLAAHLLLPYADAVPHMSAAVETLLTLPPADLAHYGPTSVALTTALWDQEARRACLTRAADAARDIGSLQALDTVLWIMSLAELSGGSPVRAAQYVEQVRELRRAIGHDGEHVVNVAQLAWSGAERSQVMAFADAARAMGFGGVHASAAGALAVRDLAEGRYGDARARLQPLVDDPFLQATPHQYPDYVEAAVRSGHRAEAAAVVEILGSMATANGSAWARGVAERSRALIAGDDDAAPVHYAAAVDALTGRGVDVDLARAHLLYGEWLRRARRRREAREHLHAALALFETTGAGIFSPRTAAELEASGRRGTRPAPIRSARPLALTPQEATVARLAAGGSTNAEIGATMFISVNTVDYHLRKVFQKLGISSRRQLRDRVGDGA
jgi:DNA-binding CsgD family transcriptional regulator